MTKEEVHVFHKHRSHHDKILEYTSNFEQEQSKNQQMQMRNEILSQLTDILSALAKLIEHATHTKPIISQVATQLSELQAQILNQDISQTQKIYQKIETHYAAINGFLQSQMTKPPLAQEYKQATIMHDKFCEKRDHSPQTKSAKLLATLATITISEKMYAHKQK